MRNRSLRKGILSVSLLFVTLVFGCGVSDSEDLPSFDEMVKDMRSEIQTMGYNPFTVFVDNVSGLGVVTQTRGQGKIKINGKWITLERHLDNIIRKELNRVVPHLHILDRKTKESALIDYELFMIREGRKFYYGVVKLHFYRPVVVVGTKKTMGAVIWFDYIPFAVEGDPIDEVEKLVKLQARKFAAVWKVGFNENP